METDWVCKNWLAEALGFDKGEPEADCTAGLVTKRWSLMSKRLRSATGNLIVLSGSLSVVCSSDTADTVEKHRASFANACSSTDALYEQLLTPNYIGLVPIELRKISGDFYSVCEVLPFVTYSSTSSTLKCWISDLNCDHWIVFSLQIESHFLPRQNLSSSIASGLSIVSMFRVVSLVLTSHHLSYQIDPVICRII